MKPSTILSLLAFAIPFASANLSSTGYHQEVANRAPADVDVHKRQSFTDAPLTFYNVGLGACGQMNVASDLVVALSSEQFEAGDCFKTVIISANGVNVQATITDMCPGCPYAGLDLSLGLFQMFQPEGQAVIYGEWSFVN